MNKQDIALVALSFGLFVSAPFLPTVVYKMAFSNMIVPFILLALLLILIRKSPIGTVALLLAVMALFVEYRNRVLSSTIPSVETPPKYEEQLKSAAPIVPGEVHPEPAQPQGSMITYKPMDDATNAFETVGSSVDTKRVDESPRTSGETNTFMAQQGLIN